MRTTDPYPRNLPDETQLIASFLLKYVEKCIVDANCLEDHEFDEELRRPISYRARRIKTIDVITRSFS
jgi:hypothetical protein